MLAAAALGITAGAACLGGDTAAVRLPAPLPGLDPLLRADALSGAFLLPVFLLSACASVYGLGYWPQPLHPGNGRRIALFSGTMTAGMALLVAAGDGATFLLGWELMALSAFLLVCAEDEQHEARTAGWLYLAAAHVGTLCLFAMFAVLQASTGSLALLPVGAVSEGARTAMFVLALCGFGIKAGIVPLHFWLPPAHAAAPSHVSALLSGVMIKTGIYGIVRMTSLLGTPPDGFGLVLLAAGAVSAFTGVAFAIGQHDLKRLLAWHSIENIGIICLGLGLAELGRTNAQPALVVLGLGGALLHVWNHALFKALLFLAAGATAQQAGTRAIDRLGGVARTMPWTAACFLCGAMAICGLPPLNGLISELLIYLGLFRAPAAGAGRAALLAIPVLAMAGAMALLCFAKVFGAVYLGTPRSAAAGCRESAPSMRWPMTLLAACCVAIGLLPMLIVPALEPAIAAWHGDSALPGLSELAPLWPLGLCGSALLALAVLLLAALRAGRRTPRAGTWDCGYAVTGSPRVQYTAESFAWQITSVLRWLLLPKQRGGRCQGLFPPPVGHHSHVPDVVLDRTLLPALRGLRAACIWLRGLQAGRVNLYLVYVFVALVVLLLLP
jgi:hydrogenase-4 component B